jgi:hypothetical protein
MQRLITVEDLPSHPYTLPRHSSYKAQRWQYFQCTAMCSLKEVNTCRGGYVCPSISKTQYAIVGGGGTRTAILFSTALDMNIVIQSTVSLFPFTVYDIFKCNLLRAATYFESLVTEYHKEHLLENALLISEISKCNNKVAFASTHLN